MVGEIRWTSTHSHCNFENWMAREVGTRLTREKTWVWMREGLRGWREIASTSTHSHCHFNIWIARGIGTKFAREDWMEIRLGYVKRCVVREIC